MIMFITGFDNIRKPFCMSTPKRDRFPNGLLPYLVSHTNSQGRSVLFPFASQEARESSYPGSVYSPSLLPHSKEALTKESPLGNK